MYSVRCAGRGVWHAAVARGPDARVGAARQGRAADSAGAGRRLADEQEAAAAGRRGDPAHARRPRPPRVRRGPVRCAAGAPGQHGCAEREGPGA